MNMADEPIIDAINRSLEVSNRWRDKKWDDEPLPTPSMEKTQEKAESVNAEPRKKVESSSFGWGCLLYLALLFSFSYLLRFSGFRNPILAGIAIALAGYGILVFVDALGLFD